MSISSTDCLEENWPLPICCRWIGTSGLRQRKHKCWWYVTEQCSEKWRVKNRVVHSSPYLSEAWAGIQFSQDLTVSQYSLKTAANKVFLTRLNHFSKQLSLIGQKVEYWSELEVHWSVISWRFDLDMHYHQWICSCLWCFTASS